MLRDQEAHVVPSSDGGWEVVQPGADSAASRHRTKNEATRSAKRLLRQQGGGEAIIHSRDGRIQESDAVPSESAPGGSRSAP